MKLYFVMTTGGVQRTMSVGLLGESMKLFLGLASPGGETHVGSLPYMASIFGKETELGERMKVYFVAADHKASNHSLYSLSESTTTRPLRVLLSYYYFRNIPLDEVLAEVFPGQPLDVFLDSGAFSAMTQGAHISLSEYARYIQKYSRVITTYANLDVIKNADATWKNQLRLESDYGLSPLPVFHVTEDWNWLEHYLERYRYIALGVAGTTAHVYAPWVVQCFKRAKERAVYHGFGITNWEVLKAFPWYSVDSSTWGKGFRFGKVSAFDDRRGTFVNFSLGNHKECYRYANLIRAHGFDPGDFADRKRNDRKKICAISALAYIKAEAWLTHRWGAIAIPGTTEKGSRMYLVENQPKLTDVRNVAPYLGKVGMYE